MTQSINHYSFSIEGMQISFGKLSLKLDPCATCDLLKDAGLIEDFAIDKNCEPVILFSDSRNHSGYGFEHWCHFVRSFPFSRRIAEMIMEYRESRKQFQVLILRINNLLSPLKAA